MYRQIAILPNDAALVARVLGVRLRDAETCYELQDELIAAIDAAGQENVVLDVSSLEFLGSIAFLSFLGVRRHVKGGRLILCGMSEPIREMFRACALTSNNPDKPAPIEEQESVDAALASIRAN